MNKIIFLTLVLVVCLKPINVEAAPKINPKTKAFLLMTAYGTVGGFLLGTASLAFETPGRAPFIGASLGLYAGLAFGSYVLVSHYVENDRKLNPQKYIDEGSSGDYGELPNQMLNQYKYETNRSDIRKINQLSIIGKKSIYLNLLNTTF
tara:strand:- start:171 stop:617 length:447 start_codon:yes stop_codon:yes gene_type:complete